MQSYIRWCCAVSVLILFCGCMGSAPKAPMKPKILSEKEVMQAPKQQAPGSLYSGYDNLFSDMKAYEVGDVVTININENLSGKGQSDVQTSRSNSVGLGVPTPKIKGRSVIKGDEFLSLDGSSQNSFSGKGGTKRSAKLIAKITARVVKVYPNGNLYIVGKKYLKINSDTQYLKIAGIVNPKDILPDNSIDSSRISDMYVEYNGQGFVTDAQEPGWLAKFVMKIWPF
ncbi:flagellar basal body L-ring protein FlgH [Nitratiruptor sp. YY08-14]|nr:flagellar basal body L-ring protein FlgH [Nitratiruptor sp. YY08-14]